MQNKEQIIIIGCGPVGLAIGLLLVKKNYKNIKIYESRKEIFNNIEESYPIGINPRALNCLELINEELKQKALDQSLLINSWDIYGGSRRVASLESTTVYGTTRGGINLLLYEEALKHKESIEINFNHKLIGIDFQTKTLKFENNNGQIIEVDGKESRIMGCDGVYSKVRREMQEQKINGFKSESQLWSSEHRVLFSKSGVQTKLDERVHYIFNGCYTAVVKRSNGEQLWTLVTAAFDRSPASERELLLSNEDSKENVVKLRKLLNEKSGKEVGDLFDDCELKRYFSRRSFRGAVIDCNRLHEGEWIVLLGDAAHSVLPPVGEGINSGLEDTVILSSIITNTTHPFNHYNQVRMPDIIALSQIAHYLNTSNKSYPPEKISRIIFIILQTIFKKLRIIQYTLEDFTFGKQAVLMKPYSQICQIWLRQKLFILNFARLIVYPISLIFYIIYLPFWLISLPFTKKSKQQERTIKPPVQI